MTMADRYNDQKRIAILYEHSEWFKPLFAEFDRRDIPYELWEAQRHSYDPRVRILPYSLVINRMSPSSYLREHGNGIFYTRQLLAYLRDIKVPVINPYEAFVVETSKALQIEIFEQLGVRYPRARVINHASLAPEAAAGFDFPVIVKPNIGGSGAKIQKFNSCEELERAATASSIDLGYDSTALLQEFLPATDGAIVRVEVLGGEFLYAIRIFTDQNGNFNLCPADICQDNQPPAEPQDFSRCLASDKRRLHIEALRPPRHVIDAAIRIAQEARLDVGGIEYLVSERNGEVYFYDVNALSNFVTDAPRIVGFDPYERFVDFVLQRALQTA
jgi:hypothetical protein